MPSYLIRFPDGILYVRDNLRDLLFILPKVNTESRLRFVPTAQLSDILSTQLVTFP